MHTSCIVNVEPCEQQLHHKLILFTQSRQTDRFWQVCPNLSGIISSHLHMRRHWHKLAQAGAGVLWERQLSVFRSILGSGSLRTTGGVREPDRFYSNQSSVPRLFPNLIWAMTKRNKRNLLFEGIKGESCVWVLKGLKEITVHNMTNINSHMLCHSQ